MTRIPLFYEYKDNNTTFMPEIKGTYVDNYKGPVRLGDEQLSDLAHAVDLQDV